ncbi:hypothetical protein MSG28_002657 [Choristoneura fumiferana]|uniref:Uncharacterized protein n=1 Tax=Choristoneura fumiferana TaxID=7141 RepID=A0ACC0JJJ0_CHOFU|nr:hypothetical protein MSG28_002657 [Choristoneura fumiferana]
MYSVLAFGIATIFLVGVPVNHAMPSPPEITKWPVECEGKTYCTKKPDNYPEKFFEELLNTKHETAMVIERSGGMENRSGEQDVGSCHSRRSMDLVYLIKDDNDRIRLVAQTETFKIIVLIEECSNPGRTLSSNVLNARLLKKHRVDCYETKVPMEFMVLSLDGSSLESVGPKGGIASSCSAKLIDKN